jgi:acyl carrier protein
VKNMVARVYAHTGDDTFIAVRQIIGDALQLGLRLEDLERDTPLVGNLPELDSMAVVTVITALEECFGFVVDDDDDVSQAFDTLGSLTKYVEAKIHA